MPDHPSRRTQLWRPVMLIVVLALLLFLAEYFHLGGRIRELRGWIQTLGMLGPVVYVLLYIGATIAMVPALILTLMAGTLFGTFLGVIVVSVGSTLGACCSFLIARYVARQPIVNWLSGNPKFMRIDEMTRKRGAIVVAFCRLVPVLPFNLLNYAFGLTGVTFAAYFLWSWLCMLPATIIYVAGADAFTKGVAEGMVPLNLILLILGVIVILVIAIFYARRFLKD